MDRADQGSASGAQAVEEEPARLIQWHHVRACVLVLVGCGRVAFDPTGDATSDTAGACPLAVDHDEDSDGIDDGCDNCPHISNVTQPDGDADGVGDACDSNPTTAGERITLFVSFATNLGPWELDQPAPTLMNDSLNADTRANSLLAIASAPLGNERFEMGGHIFDDSTTQRQIFIFNAVGARSEVPFYYCELNSSVPTDADLGLVSNLDGTTIVGIDSVPAMPPLSNGDFRLAIDIGPATATCRATWAGVQLQAGGPLPAYASMTKSHGFEIRGINVRLDYVIRIASP